MHLDKNEIIEMISTLALIETEAADARKKVNEQGPHAVSARHQSVYFIECRARQLKNDLITRIS